MTADNDLPGRQRRTTTAELQLDQGKRTASHAKGCTVTARWGLQLPCHSLALVFAIVLGVIGVRLFFTVSGTGREDITIALALAYVVVGVCTGALSGLLGVGGGAIMVPIMAVLFGVPSVIAKGTSLAVIIPTALMGTLRNRSNQNVDLGAAVVVGITGIAMAVVGAWVAASMSDAVSNALFALLLIAVAGRMLRQAWNEGARAKGA